MDSREPPTTLAHVLGRCWTLLAEGQARRESPFHQGVLATTTERGPSARYVVLRQVDREQGVLAFHTDRRSPKLAEIRRDPRVALCFFGHGMQIRAEGRAQAHDDDAVADAAWQRAGLMSRRCYLASAAPGSAAPGPTSGLPAHLESQRPGEAESQAGRAHFSVVQVRLERLDWLSLAFEGHRRAVFRRGPGAGAAWQGEWRVP